jgi:hypothetical protein
MLAARDVFPSCAIIAARTYASLSWCKVGGVRHSVSALQMTSAGSEGSHVEDFLLDSLRCSRATAETSQALHGPPVCPRF